MTRTSILPKSLTIRVMVDSTWVSEVTSHAYGFRFISNWVLLRWEDMCSIEDVAAGRERSMHALLPIQLFETKYGYVERTRLRRIERKQ